MRKAYETGGKYIQTKFPLQNEVLKLLSSIDPRCQGSTAAAEMMKKLKVFFPTVIPKDQFDNVDKEIDEFHLEDVTPARETDGKEKQLDKWWAEVFQLSKFPLLSKLIKACLCIFSGPMVEQSFR